MTTGAPPTFRWKGSVAVLLVATVALAGVATFVPRFRGRAVQVFMIVVGAVLIRLLVRAVVEATARPGPFAFDRALAPLPMYPLATPSEPERIRFEVGAATHRSMELHHQFRRRMRRLAQGRLAVDHGVDMDGDPEAARRLLGDEAWGLLRPDLEPPSDRFGPGMPVEGVTRIVDAVEGLSR
jgi:hypothetical protein